MQIPVVHGFCHMSRERLMDLRIGRLLIIGLFPCKLRMQDWLLMAIWEVDRCLFSLQQVPNYPIVERFGLDALQSSFPKSENSVAGTRPVQPKNWPTSEHIVDPCWKANSLALEPMAHKFYLDVPSTPLLIGWYGT